MIFLKGKKVYLRPVTERDLKGDYLNWINDPENDVFTDHALFAHDPKSLKEFRSLKQDDKRSLWLAIIEIKTGKHVGNIELTAINWVHKTGEYKILIDKKYSGKGYGFEASTLILAHGFHKLNLERIQLGVNAENKPAIFLYKKLGFVKEGVLRGAFLRHGKRQDVIIMGLFRKEFKD